MSSYARANLLGLERRCKLLKVTVRNGESLEPRDSPGRPYRRSESRYLQFGDGHPTSIRWFARNVSSLPLQVPIVRQYVREPEAAAYMGVKVATWRARRLLRSKKGPPFTRVGRMVMYLMAALEEHIRAGLIPYRD
jgi:helix-turn-helix protein